MKRHTLNGIMALCLLAWIFPAQAQNLQDGSRTDNLVQIGNAAGFNDAAAALSVAPGGTVLSADQTAEGFPFFPLRSAWYSTDFAPGGTNSGVYSIAADFRPGSVSSECRGGVMGWLNLETQTGLAFYVRPAGGTASFRLATINFGAQEAAANETTANLYNLDGTDATFEAGSAAADLGTYDPQSFATFQISFQPPSAADLKVLSNAVSHVVATVTQTNASGTVGAVGKPIELLVALPLPAVGKHRVGYFASWGSLSGTGLIGLLDNLAGSGSIAPVTNLPPVVTLTAPLVSQTLISPAEVVLSAEASDPDGLVTQVEFRAGTLTVGRVTEAPYTLVWKNPSAGVYALRAVATDNKGAVTASQASVNLTIKTNQPPVVSAPVVTFSTPGSGTVLKVPGTVSLGVTATDADGTVTQVEFFSNGASLGVVTNAPFKLDYTFVSAGTNILTAVATDDLGLATSSVESLLVSQENLSPVVRITSPASGSVVTGSSLSIAVAASDVDGRVLRLEAFAGASTSIAVLQAAGGSGLPSTTNLVWSLGSAPAGIYSLSVVATDDQGASTRSASVQVEVKASVPDVNPSLAITAQGAGWVVAWPVDVAGYALQASPTLSNPVWTTLSAPGNRLVITNVTSLPARFYRLLKP